MQEIKKKAAEVVESRKNSNNILEIINHLDLDEAGNTAAAAIKALKRIFTIAIEKHELCDEAEEKQEMSADEKYKVWMMQRFNEIIKKLSVLVHHSKGSVSNLSIATLISFINVLWTSNSNDSNDWGAKEKEILNNSYVL